MKIRIAPQSIRIRIKPAELATLHATGSLHQGLTMGPSPDHVLTFKLLVTADSPLLSISYTTKEVLVSVSPMLVAEMQETERVGASVTQELKAGGSLKIIVEKDFKCLTHRDEDVDAFPNPEARRA